MLFVSTLTGKPRPSARIHDINGNDTPGRVALVHLANLIGANPAARHHLDKRRPPALGFEHLVLVEKAQGKVRCPVVFRFWLAVVGEEQSASLGPGNGVAFVSQK